MGNYLFSCQAFLSFPKRGTSTKSRISLAPRELSIPFLNPCTPLERKEDPFTKYPKLASMILMICSINSLKDLQKQYPIDPADFEVFTGLNYIKCIGS